METNKNTPENDGNTNENANSAYSGSGSMQPGGSTGKAGRLNDCEKDDVDNHTGQKNNTSRKSIAEATDPSKLSDI